MKSNYKREKYWCGNCDAEIVEHGKKCSHCGVRNGEKTKKPKHKKLLTVEQL